MRQLYLISDRTSTGQSDLHNALSFRDKYQNIPFNVIDLSTVSWSEFTKELTNISPDNAVLLLSAFRDKNNDNLTFNQSLDLIIKNVKAPVFHLYDQGIGRGLIGGVLVSHEEHGRKAAAKAIEILSGKPVRSVPILLESPNLPIFDYRQLVKFHIPLSLLPANTQIRYRNEQTSVLIIYWREITVVSIILLFTLVIVLARQNKISKEHNNILEENELKLRTILDNVDAYIFMKDMQGNYQFANQALCSLLKLPREQIISKTTEQLSFRNNGQNCPNR